MNKNTIIKSIHAEEFVKDLMNFIFNFDNALLFKVSETKIKNTRQNIALKFKGKERNNVYTDFLLKLQSRQIKVLPDNKDSYVFVI